jgi:hypothetical protein
MSVRKLSQLPASPGRDLLMECEKRGIAALGDAHLAAHLDATAIFLLGLAEVVSEILAREAPNEPR